MMRISIITPSLNQGRFIGEALESVRAQQYPNLEHLIYDGGSTDETPGVLRACDDHPQWAHLRWRSEPDSGQSDALNRGFDEAQGDIVGWLNADDRYSDGCFRQVLRAFAEDATLDVLYGDLAEIDERGRLRRVRREAGFSRFILLYHHVLYIPTPTAFFRRRVFAEGNRLQPELHYAMDYEFFLRLSAQGYQIRHIPQVLAEFRTHPQSKSFRMARAQAAEKRQVMCLHSSVAKKLRSPKVRHAAFFALALAAAVLRRLRKAARGDFFSFVVPGMNEEEV
jgi:glycosyltransferase involved in cell wall biosynthesis